MAKSFDALAHPAAFLTIFIWGTTFVSTKYLLADFTPIEIVLLRFVLGFIVLSFFCREKRRKSTKSEPLYVCAGLTGVTLYFLFENIALTYTFASVVGIAVCAAPFFTGILAHIFLKTEKLSLRFLCGFIIAICGITILSFNGETLSRSDTTGILLSLGAALVWGVYSIMLKKISREGYSSITVTRSVFFYGILFMIPALFIFDVHTGAAENAQRFGNPVYVANLLYLGICASAVCFATWSFSVKILGALKTSVYIYLSPVITVLFSVIILNELLTMQLAAGTCLTLLGLLVSINRKSKKS